MSSNKNIRAIYTIDTTTKQPLPLYTSGVSAGFPSPADDHLDRELDLNEHLIHNPAATFFVRSAGTSMIGAGIHDGDLLIVDKSLQAKHGSIVVAVVEGDFTVKRLIKAEEHCILMPENPSCKPLIMTPDMDWSIWGVVTNVIHSLV